MSSLSSKFIIQKLKRQISRVHRFVSSLLLFLFLALSCFLPVRASESKAMSCDFDKTEEQLIKREAKAFSPPVSSQAIKCCFVWTDPDLILWFRNPGDSILDIKRHVPLKLCSLDTIDFDSMSTCCACLRKFSDRDEHLFCEESDSTQKRNLMVCLHCAQKQEKAFFTQEQLASIHPDDRYTIPISRIEYKDELVTVLPKIAAVFSHSISTLALISMVSAMPKSDLSSYKQQYTERTLKADKSTHEIGQKRSIVESCELCYGGILLRAWDESAPHSNICIKCLGVNLSRQLESAQSAGNTDRIKKLRNRLLFIMLPSKEDTKTVSFLKISYKADKFKKIQDKKRPEKENFPEKYSWIGRCCTNIPAPSSTSWLPTFYNATDTGIPIADILFSA